MDILQTVKDLLFWIVIISVCIIFLRAAINTFIHPREYDGTLLIGKGSDGRKIYRFEIDDKALDDMDNLDDILIKIEKTNKNMEINQRLYDLEADDIHTDAE